MKLYTFIILIISSVLFADLNINANDKINLKKLDSYKRSLALTIAENLSDKSFCKILTSKISQNKKSCGLVSLVKEYNSFKPQQQSLTNVALLDFKIREAKGIQNRLGEILEIRMENSTQIDKNVLVAYVPDGNEKSWKGIEAFDSNGKSHMLDTHKTPKQSVLIVGLNAEKDMRAGLALLNDELQQAGLQTASTRKEGLNVSKLNYIRVEDDKEPWILGDAEMYVLVNGISTEANKANVISLEMPYLDKDGRDYYPNQVLVVWENYRYKAANINVYEHDDSTNYKEIAALLVQKLGNIAPEYKNIFDVASQIIKLMPDSWFVNDDDYVDVFYTLEQGKTYTNFPGASRNAKMTLVPHTISGE